MNIDALRKAIKYAGSAKALAGLLELEPATVTNWVYRGRIPPKRIPQIARAVNFHVTCHELDPDLWPTDYRPCPPAKPASTPNAGS